MPAKRARKLTPGPHRADLTGRRFGRLVVRYLHHIDPHHKGYWACDCECGVTGKIIRDSKLTGGLVLSCGCWRADPAVRQAARLQIDPGRRKELAMLGGAAFRAKLRAARQPARSTTTRQDTHSK